MKIGVYVYGIAAVA
jgi:hypothetical protein